MSGNPVGILFYEPRAKPLSTIGLIQPGCYYQFYLTGTTTPANVYADGGLTSVLSQTPGTGQTTAASDGRLIPIYLSPLITYRVQLYSALGVLLEDTDPFVPVSTTTPTQAVIGQILYPQTSGEVAAGVTPVNYFYPPQTAIRYASNTTPGTTDMAGGIQSAIDSSSSLSGQVQISSLNSLSLPLLIRSSTIQGIEIVGNTRTSTTLQPLSSNIQKSPQNVNALIINQNNNPHLHLRKWEFFDNTAYTGVLLYCKEGGCSDGTGQALFSGVFEDLWLSPSSNNSGCFRGGFSNLNVSRCTFESIKTGCFIIEGAGNSDQQYVGCVMNACFDSFIYGAIDTTTKAMISVNGLHAYQHMRGPLIQINNGVEMVFQDIILEPNSVNFGSTGLFSFQDCKDVLCTNFVATTANGEPKCAVGINLVNGFTGKFSDGKITGTVGLQISGTGVLDLTVDNVDFIGCDTAFQQLSGNLSGDIYFRNCRLNNNQLYGLLVIAGTASWNLTLEDCEIINCGLNGTATNRNMDVNTSGAIRLLNCHIGQNNVGAAAADYIRAVGTGTFTVDRPTIVGTPPTALVDASSTQAITFVWITGYGGTLASASTITLPNSGDMFDVSGTTTITSISSTNQQGRRITLAFQGALTVTDGNNLLLAGNFVTTSQDALTLVCIGTNWYETGRSVN